MSELPEFVDIAKTIAAMAEDANASRNAVDLARDEAKAWDAYALAWIARTEKLYGSSNPRELAFDAEKFANDMLARRRRAFGLDLSSGEKE
jgi:hypothetical protein